MNLAYDDEQSIAELLITHNDIKAKRLQLDTAAKKLKKIEEEIKSLIMLKMQQESMTSVKCTAGMISISTARSVTTQDREGFIKWLASKPHLLDEVLSSKPYTQTNIKGMIGDSDDLPPGLTWFSEIKLSIRKV